MGYITETDSDEYMATNFSNALAIPIIGDAYPALGAGAHQSYGKFSEYLQKNTSSPQT
ncbi:hypothetical protein BKA58DRAFT_441909 [Alternaria rosae]|uniref:uncharacterized protein n=1 Tax=Alternaria rosae TaxID=1187941 RepID=UPI001E8EAE27|nr:uncharacterized protein BKA58DRAFT_441909 [Alternaria rosae]KAH6866913.1 hypothetical protein BKA58DRAFT_441909 [Alternaria rosae]